CHGRARDQLITLTEGVIPHEERGSPAALDADAVAISSRGPDHVLVEVTAAETEWLRLGLSWPLDEGERVTGLGARHGLDLDQRGRCLQLGADRRYTGPDCPPEFLENGGIPPGDYAPVPWVLSPPGWSAPPATPRPPGGG